MLPGTCELMKKPPAANVVMFSRAESERGRNSIPPMPVLGVFRKTNRISPSDAAAPLPATGPGKIRADLTFQSAGRNQEEKSATEKPGTAKFDDQVGAANPDSRKSSDNSFESAGTPESYLSLASWLLA